MVQSIKTDQAFDAFGCTVPDCKHPGSRLAVVYVVRVELSCFLKTRVGMQDLREATQEALKRPAADKDSMAPVYGMNAKMPDRHLVGEYLVCYQDALLSL